MVGDDHLKNTMVTCHPQIPVPYPDGDCAESIDVGIAPLIWAIWEHGIDTVNFCQEDQPGYMWVEFDTAIDLEEFLMRLISKLPVTIHPEKWGIMGCDVKGAWQYSIHFDDYRDSFTSPCSIKAGASLRFPADDYWRVCELIIQDSEEA
jgi:hypothetical protein